jgi:hypothetical protein
VAQNEFETASLGAANTDQADRGVNHNNKRGFYEYFPKFCRPRSPCGHRAKTFGTYTKTEKAMLESIEIGMQFACRRMWPVLRGTVARIAATFQHRAPHRGPRNLINKIACLSRSGLTFRRTPKHRPLINLGYF